MAIHPSKGAQPNQSLIDGIATLQALATSPNPVGGRELARRLGFEHTRVNRMLKTLAYLGIARQTADRKYAPGPGMHVLAAQSLFASGIVTKVLPVLQDLRQFGHTVAMGVIWRDVASYLFHGPPGVPISDAIGRIGVFPATRGGIGLSLLAAMSDEVIEDIYRDREIEGDFDTLQALQTFLADVRARGYVRVQVRPEPLQHTIAMPVGDPPVFAIGVSGWIPEQATQNIVLALQNARARLVDPNAPPDDDADLTAEFRSMV